MDNLEVEEMIVIKVLMVLFGLFNECMYMVKVGGCGKFI